MDVAALVQALEDQGQELESRLRHCLSEARQYIEAERGCLMITHTGREALIHDGDDSLNLKFPFSRNVVGQAMVGQTSLVTFQSPEELSSSMRVHGVRAALCAPLLGPNNEDVGVIYFDTRLGKEFTQGQLDRIQELATAIASVLV